MSGTWIFFPVLLFFCSYYQVCWWKLLWLQTFILSLSSAHHQPQPCTHVFKYRLWIICIPALSLNSASSFPGHFTCLCGGQARAAVKWVSVSCIARGQWGGVRNPRNCGLYPHRYSQLQESPIGIVPLLVCGCHGRTSEVVWALMKLCSWPSMATCQHALSTRARPSAPCIVIPVIFPLGSCRRYRYHG